MFRKKPNQRKPWGASAATSDPVFLHCGHEGRRGFWARHHDEKTRVESLCCGLRCHRIRKLRGDEPDDDDVREFQLSDTA
jgi:hypothetical protein